MNDTKKIEVCAAFLRWHAEHKPKVWWNLWRYNLFFSGTGGFKDMDEGGESVEAILEAGLSPGLYAFVPDHPADVVFYEVSQRTINEKITLFPWEVPPSAKEKKETLLLPKCHKCKKETTHLFEGFYTCMVCCPDCK